MLLKDKVIAISGAASDRGIGLATARLLASHGATVAILDLDATSAAQAATTLEAGDHIGLACDVADRDACERAAAAIIDRYGRIDVLINNAGITQPLKTMEIDPDSWRRVLDVNLGGVLYLSQAVIPHMRARKSGSIACMSSVSAQRGGGIFGGPHYSAAKAGVLGLAKAMARELGPDNIRVNCVVPGWVMTERQLREWVTPEAEELIDASQSLPRRLSPADVARLVLWLAADDSAMCTGQNWVVDAGWI
jgi:NAD(P)-dependent dehydrogenase (short-subunit alcohol dehydrogenase family)